MIISHFEACRPIPAVLTEAGSKSSQGQCVFNDGWAKPDSDPLTELILSFFKQLQRFAENITEKCFCNVKIYWNVIGNLSVAVCFLHTRFHIITLYFCLDKVLHSFTESQFTECSCKKTIWRGDEYLDLGVMRGTLHAVCQSLRNAW